MPEVGVRELKVRASEIVRDVRDRRIRYMITYRGRPVGVLMPLDDAQSLQGTVPSAGGDAVWNELTQLGEKIGRRWQSSQSSTDLLSTMRR